MQAIWVSFKENANCGRRLTDALCHSEKVGKDRGCIFKKDNSSGGVVHQREEQAREEVIFRQKQPQNLYYELHTGDPSRNIVEMIFQAALTQPSKHCRKIKKVLRVNKSIETVERFEKYRDMVKKRAHAQHKKHLRSTVDGNEVLQFYGTTMNCCIGKGNKVSEGCKDLTCRVCRIIQSGFDTAYMRKNGIQLSTSSEELSEDMIKVIKGKNVRRAVIICRMIAGTVTNVVDERSRGEYDSIKIEGYSKSGYLIAQNPCAVLPCFVVVFN